MADIVKQMARPIQMADQVTKSADDANYMRSECLEIKSKTEKLAGLLRQAARNSSDLYERPTRRIIDDTEQVLDKSLTLVLKCSANGLRRVFTIIPQAAFRKVAQQLENSIGDVTWLLRVSAPADERDDEYLGLPPIAANEPILCLIWEQIAILASGSLEERADAAASLVSLARDNDRYGKLIIEEGGIPPLLKLAKEGRLEGQESAARAVGLLGRDPESVEHIVNAGVCAIFAKILKEGHMQVQVVVAWAVSELAANHPKCQDHFIQNNMIRLLVGHLAFETIQEHSKYTIPTKQANFNSIHNVVMANTNTNSTKIYEEDKQYAAHISRPASNNNQMHSIVANTMALKTQTQTKQVQDNPKKSHPANHTHVSLAGSSIKGREYEDPITKAQMKAGAARALRYLCSGNVAICKIITESRALLCFAVLLEKGAEEVQYNSVMALMEIASVAEENSELRRSAFKPTTPACKAVVDQLLKIIEKADSELLIPCVRAIGHLARTFRATESRIIAPLVRLLDEKEPDVTQEAVISLTKFAETENYLHLNHCKAIIDAGGAKHLIQLVYFGEQMIQPLALILLGYIAYHVPDNEALAQAEVLVVIEWASKQNHLMQEPMIESLLTDAKTRLELYQSRGTRGYH